MQYYTRKSWKCGINFFWTTLPCAWASAHGKFLNLPSACYGARQREWTSTIASAASSLPCALMQAHDKHLLLPCATVFAVCRAVGRTAKFTFAVFLYFAMCLSCSTRQRGPLLCARFWAHGKVAAHGNYAVSGSVSCCSCCAWNTVEINYWICSAHGVDPTIFNNLS